MGEDASTPMIDFGAVELKADGPYAGLGPNVRFKPIPLGSGQSRNPDYRLTVNDGPLSRNPWIGCLFHAQTTEPGTWIACCRTGIAKEVSMPMVLRDRRAILAGMRPVLRDGEFVFCTIADTSRLPEALAVALASFREDEGVALVLELQAATDFGFDTSSPMRRIVLEVFSALDGVGLTAAVSAALADEGIPCNVIAAYHHDNVFVPAPMAERALSALRAVQTKATY
jgi:hypothetical protein